MKAMHWDGSRLAVIETAAPEASEGRALVRVLRAGICNTDLEIARGYMGFRGVLGHEFVGVVEDGPAIWRGRRVVGEINFACGRCPECAKGLGRHCPERSVLGILDADGAFAEYVVVPVENLHAVPDGIPDDDAVFVEPLAAAFEILAQVEVGPGLQCTVLGDGKLGLLAAQVLRQSGAEVLAVGKHPAKLSLLAARGIETVLFDQWDRRRRDLVVEATGTARGFKAAVAATKPRGTLVLKSTVAGDEPLNLAQVVIDEINIVGSRCGPFAPALRALGDGSVTVRPLISARVPLRDAARAMDLAAQPGILKVLIDCAYGS